MKNRLLYIFLILSLISCENDDNDDNDVENKTREITNASSFFQGIWAIESITSLGSPVDINNDGTTNRELLLELPTCETDNLLFINDKLYSIREFNTVCDGNNIDDTIQNGDIEFSNSNLKFTFKDGDNLGDNTIIIWSEFVEILGDDPNKIIVEFSRFDATDKFNNPGTLRYRISKTR